MSKASAYFTVGDIHGKHGVKALKRALDTLHGVSSVSVGEGRIAVDYDTTGVARERIQKEIEKLGFAVSEAEAEIVRR